MAYCRWSKNCDLYIFQHIGGYYICCNCPDVDENTTSYCTPKAQEMVDHIKKHREDGLKVPVWLEEEISKDGDIEY